MRGDVFFSILLLLACFASPEKKKMEGKFDLLQLPLFPLD